MSITDKYVAALGEIAELKEKIRIYEKLIMQDKLLNHSLDKLEERLKNGKE